MMLVSIGGVSINIYNRIGTSSILLDIGKLLSKVHILNLYSRQWSIRIENPPCLIRLFNCCQFDRYVCNTYLKERSQNLLWANMAVSGWLGNGYLLIFNIFQISVVKILFIREKERKKHKCMGGAEARGRGRIPIEQGASCQFDPRSRDHDLSQR